VTFSSDLVRFSLTGFFSIPRVCSMSSEK
jgi:hypothetical protein